MFAPKVEVATDRGPVTVGKGDRGPMLLFTGPFGGETGIVFNEVHVSERRIALLQIDDRAVIRRSSEHEYSDRLYQLLKDGESELEYEVVDKRE